MNNNKANKFAISEVPYWFLRISALLSFILIFFPAFNVFRISEKVSKNLSIFTTAVSWENLIQDVKYSLRVKELPVEVFQWLRASAIIVIIGLVLCAIGACMSLGNNRMKRTAFPSAILGSVFVGLGLLFGYLNGYVALEKATVNTSIYESVLPRIPSSFYFYIVLAAITFVSALISFLTRDKNVEKKMEMVTTYKLFLIMLPFLILCFIFSYLPLFGWRFAFFKNVKIGKSLSMDDFVWFDNFKFLLTDPATRSTVLKVLRNTLAMSGLGILTSWLPMVFAIFLNEIKAKPFKRLVQVFTTIPNFVSWVLVYSLALAIFSTDGLINILSGTSIKFLEIGPQYTWLKMLAWGTWKGIGWSAIIYIAGISGIPQDLYEAATVDGAGRFQKMWHITLPGLVPTFFVLLLMSVGNILSNGMDQYLVFSNSKNMDYINVLDLYVYNLGLGDADLIPLSTVVSMTKSLISVVLLFLANGISKSIRGESIM